MADNTAPLFQCGRDDSAMRMVGEANANAVGVAIARNADNRLFDGGLHIVVQAKPTSPPFYARYVMPNGRIINGYGRTTLEAVSDAMDRVVDDSATP